MNRRPCCLAPLPHGWLAMPCIDAMPSYPLVSHPSLDQTIAWRDGAPVSVRAFLVDVTQLAAVLPAGGHVFNACADRYRFAVGLCATLVAGKVSLLPPMQTPEMGVRTHLHIHWF